MFAPPGSCVVALLRPLFAQWRYVDLKGYFLRRLRSNPCIQGYFSERHRTSRRDQGYFLERPRSNPRIQGYFSERHRTSRRDQGYFSERPRGYPRMHVYFWGVSEVTPA